MRDMKPSHIPDSERKKDVGSVVRNKSIAGRRIAGICFLVVTGTKHYYSRYKTLRLSLILSLYVSPQSKRPIHHLLRYFPLQELQFVESVIFFD